MRTMKTKFDEVRITTSDPKKMLQMFIAKELRRGWKEDFVDEDTGTVVTIDRYETIAKRGQVINGDLLAQIQFYMAAGDVTEVEVSNQRREGILQVNTYAYPWEVVLEIVGKPVKFLLYASDIEMAIAITVDYAEQNFGGQFAFRSARAYKSCIMITDKIAPLPAPKEEKEVDNIAEPFGDIDFDDEPDLEPNTSKDNPWYFIEVYHHTDEIVESATFVVQSKDADDGLGIIRAFISQKQHERAVKNNEEIRPFKLTLRTAKTINCKYVIDREVSDKYVEQRENKLQTK